MRKPLSIVAALALVGSALVGPASGGPTTGGLATDNVEHIKHIPIAQNGVGGRLIGKYFYMNDQNKVMIWDVSDPLDPQMTGFVPMPQEWQFSREDIDGNGEILVVPNTASGQNDGNPQTTSPINAVYIIDVEDKTNPKIISKVPGVAELRGDELRAFASQVAQPAARLGVERSHGSGAGMLRLRYGLHARHRTSGRSAAHRPVQASGERMTRWCPEARISYAPSGTGAGTA